MRKIISTIFKLNFIYVLEECFAVFCLQLCLFLAIPLLFSSNHCSLKLINLVKWSNKFSSQIIIINYQVMLISFLFMIVKKKHAKNWVKWKSWNMIIWNTSNLFSSFSLVKFRTHNLRISVIYFLIMHSSYLFEN